MPPSGWARHLARLNQTVDSIDWRQLRVSASKQAERFRAYMEQGAEPAPDAAWHSKWLRPKGNISRGELAILLTAFIVPLVMVVIRISAFPGVLGPGLSNSLLPSIGRDLNQMLSLETIPPNDRSRVLYMLFLPTSAMLIAVARLTFGIRVLGFRAILISVGFQVSGILPSLILIGVMVTIVFMVRPWLIRVRLPHYARLSVILCTSVVVLLGAVLVAPWARSDVLWGVAFFPVIVLGLMAEGIAKTLDRDSGLTAAWRTGMTIAIALVLAVICQIPLVREVAIQFPELVFTQIVAIILIAEFLDLRLLQDWDARLSGVAVPRLFSQEQKLRVVVVKNQRKNRIIGRMGLPTRNGYSRRGVRRIVGALREAGHTVKVFEGDMSLLSKLQDFIPPHPTTGQPGGIAFNLAHGIQGDAPVAHVPAMLEMAGVAYTGPTSLGHLLALDKVVAGQLLRQAGVPTPDSRTMSRPQEEMEGLNYPVVVKPRHAPRYGLRIAENRGQLEEAVRAVSRRHKQDAVVEQFVPGREIHVALLGNASVECLPFVEVNVGDEENDCPATLDPDLARRIHDAAVAAFEACGCRDYALVNLRVLDSGEPKILELESIGVLEEGGSFEQAAVAAGYTYAELIERILYVARERYRGEAPAPSLAVVPNPAEAGREKRTTVVAG
ncbi:MAG: ATP-grasp domain-containing protein [Deltaproteobacteria bacterium]|nr:ATP-grasp domain-containing protein [Deltaproteobacteria bacterium]MBW2421371.1 ATP-grasp domain-containing protein [Deltaproteobacteria bacterium]